MISLPLITENESASETEALGGELAELLRSDTSLPRFIALYGDLGVGKTAFVRGFCARLAPDARVKSPTFALVHEYLSVPVPVFHFDMYRITDDDELYSTGFYDYLERDGYILTEWSENIPFGVPERCISVNIEKSAPGRPDRRKITIRLKSKA